MRRLIRDISSVLIISGLLLVLDAGVTLVWQEPVTAVVAMVKRSQIDQRFLSYHSAPLTNTDRSALSALRSMEQRISFLARREQRQVRQPPRGRAPRVERRTSAGQPCVAGVDQREQISELGELHHLVLRIGPQRAQLWTAIGCEHQELHLVLTLPLRSECAIRDPLQRYDE